MAKVLNGVFGIGIAVVVYILVLLGIQAFYPEPLYEDFCNQTMYAQPMGFAKCTDNMTVGECRKNTDAYDKEMMACQKDYDKTMEIYNRNFFMISSILGLIIVIIAFFLMNLTNISAGVACSGIVLIMWAFMRGWRSTDNKLKFFIGLIIAIAVIVLAVIVNKKLSNTLNKKKKQK
jgi:uncharacterized membrane protein